MVGQCVVKLIEEQFSAESAEVLADNTLFGDFMQSVPEDPDVIDPKIYQDCGSFDDVSNKFNEFLRQYNDDDLYQ